MTKERTRQKLIARGEQLKKGLKWWQKEFPNDKDLPLRMFVNGEYHATFNDLLILKLIESEFKRAGHTVELKYPEGVTDWRLSLIHI